MGLNEKQLKFLEENLRFSCFGHDRGINTNTNMPLPQDMIHFTMTSNESLSDKEPKKAKQKTEAVALTDSQIRSILDFKATLMKMNCEEEDYNRLKAFVISQMKRRRMEEGLQVSEMTFKEDEVLNFATDLFKTVIASDSIIFEISSRSYHYYLIGWIDREARTKGLRANWRQDQCHGRFLGSRFRGRFIECRRP